MEEASRGVGRIDELMRTHPYLPKRVTALRLFAQTTYFRSLVGTAATGGAEPAGISKDECDARVNVPIPGARSSRAELTFYHR